jgi:hypothetical protein
MPLVGALLDSIDPEDRQQQRQIREVVQERPEAPAAGFGLAWVEP